ncbi:Gfo/Idh/MocA family oxidoreductase [Clostridium sp. CX1]|uniref:Gfo/Idh/MocA family protein n=1 Tax=Clostridium sp. CX1 TaxID=2978346 RepID=UPI0021BE7BD3|nr:Gfo/Idh/MocA family oxidoreductase [Clostridium sp. CX1]MCT8978620.1 Gfo/Idh/MocA family oxidoreductase [Clostridium sp. CX1]
MVNFAVIGTNKITDEFIKAASLIEDFKLNAVYSRTEEGGRAFAERYGIKNVFTDLQEMAKSDCIDAVYIASPNSFHSEQAIICLNNKKHVLCEKPIASNVSELNSMILTAKSNDVLLMEAMKTTFLPNFKAIENNIHKLGKIRRYFASYCQYSSRYDLYKEGKAVNTFDLKFSNGAIMDIGTYCIHPLVRLFGMPKDIKSTALKLPSGVDGEGSLVLSYEDMDGVIMYSKITDSHVPCEIQGEKGSMIIDKINNTEKVQIIYRNGDVEDLSVPQLKDTMYYEAKEFIDLIKNNEKQSEVNSYSQSLKVMKIIEISRKETGIIFPADNKLV